MTDFISSILIMIFRACSTHKRKLGDDDFCTPCNKSLKEDQTCRNFSVELYVETEEGGVYTVKTWADRFDASLTKADDLEGALGELSGKGVKVDCDGEKGEDGDGDLTTVRIMFA